MSDYNYRLNIPSQTVIKNHRSVRLKHKDSNDQALTKYKKDKNKKKSKKDFKKDKERGKALLNDGKSELFDKKI